MGKANVVAKRYMSDNERFADVFNYYLYKGEKVIMPKNLKERDTTELTEIVSNNNVYTKENYRDILKECVIKCDEEKTYILLGIENQQDIHYAMPVRSMLYDAMNYTTQVEAIAKKHKKNKDLKGVEFLSGFSKCDKIYPIVTLIVYFGNDEWDAPRSLYEMLELKDERLLKFVENYKLNLIIPKEIKNLEKFSTDIRYIMEVIKASGEKKKLKEFIENNREGLSNIRTDAALMLQEIVTIKTDYNEKEVETDMCKAWEEMLMDREIETVIRLYLKNYLNINQAVEVLNMSIEEFNQKVEEYRQQN